MSRKIHSNGMSSSTSTTFLAPLMVSSVFFTGLDCDRYTVLAIASHVPRVSASRFALRLNGLSNDRPVQLEPDYPADGILMSRLRYGAFDVGMTITAPLERHEDENPTVPDTSAAAAHERTKTRANSWFYSIADCERSKLAAII